MHRAAIVCCGARDEAMLPLFIARWRRLTDVPLWLGNCTSDPVSNTHGLPTVPVTWGRGVAKSILAAMLSTGAEFIAKLDVDSFLLSTDWLWAPYADPKILNVGIQIAAHPGNYWGIGYSLRRSAILALEKAAAPCRMASTEDDTEICHAVRLLDPQSVYLHPVMESIRRSDTYDPSEKSIFALHCGIYGRTIKAREYAFQELSRCFYGSCHESQESVWASISIMPHRFAIGIDVIKTLLRQTHQPEKICIAISPHYTRTGESFTPEQIQTLTKLSPRIRLVNLPDDGPVNKYLAAAYAPEEAIILTLDDDRIYSVQIIERMLAEYHGGLLANATTTIEGKTIAEAYAGVMWRRDLLNVEELRQQIEQIQEHNPEYLLADDVIIAQHIRPVRAMEKPVGNRQNTSSQDSSALHQAGNGHRERYTRLIRYLSNIPDTK